MARTRVSSKGQVVIPSEVRKSLGWGPGTELEVDLQEGNVVLRAASPFPRTRLEDLIGCTGYKGPPISVEEMDAGIARMFRGGKR